MWIFALVILALFFLWNKNDRRNDCGNGYEAIMPALAIGAMDKNKCYGGGYNGENLWDVERDMMREFGTTGREFGDVKKEIMQTAWTGQKENAHYFYEQQKTNLLGFKDTEIQGMRNTSEIVKRIDALESRIANDRLRQLEIENSQFRTVLGVRGYGAVPSVPACPPYDGCNHGYQYGYGC